MKKIKKVKRIKRNTDKELVDFTISQLPNLFDGVPRPAASRIAVEKFIEELKKKL